MSDQVRISKHQLEEITNALDVALSWMPADQDEAELREVTAAYDLCMALAEEHSEEQE
jgi:hypothetical protein